MYDYKARWYDPALGRFISPDSYVPESQGVQAWDRYAYVNNNPVNATDPSGHSACWDNSANDPGCNQYAPTGLGLLLKESVPEKVTPPTLTEKIMQGDTSALVELLIPSHFGGRVQIEISLDVGIGLSGSAGANIVYNRNSDELAANVDWALEPGIGIGAGASGTIGPLVGWGSSSANDVTQGYSGIISATGAAEAAAAVAVTVPIDQNGFHVDPFSGQVPATFYLGGGAGGGYAGIGMGINGPTKIYTDLTPYLPWH